MREMERIVGVYTYIFLASALSALWTILALWEDRSPNQAQKMERKIIFTTY